MFSDLPFETDQQAEHLTKIAVVIKLFTPS